LSWPGSSSTTSTRSAAPGEGLRGVPLEEGRRLLAALYDEDAPRALPASLRAVEECLGGGGGAALGGLVHRLVGSALAAGAPALAWHARRFGQAPAAEGAARMRRALEEARAQLRAVGALPAGGGEPEADPAAPAAAGASPPRGGDLVCLGLDANWSGRATHALVFEHCLGADMARSRSLGGRAGDADAFVDAALGRLDAGLRPVEGGARRHADVVLLSQRLAAPAALGAAPTGGDVAARLARLGFRGVVCLLTALDGAALEAARSLPGVDLVLSKGAPRGEMGARLRVAMGAKRAEARARLLAFRREARRATNAAAQLLQQGGDGPTARRPALELAPLARRADAGRAADLCESLRAAPRGVAHCAAVLAAVSAAAAEAFEAAVGAAEGELPADLALVLLAQLR